MYRYYYGAIEINKMKSNNWKKLHGIPIKAKCKVAITDGDLPGTVVAWSLNEYISKRSVRKRKKYRFRHTWNIFKAIELQNKPELQRIYNRYGYSRKKMRRKIRRMQKRITI